MSNLGNRETMSKNINYYLKKHNKTRRQVCDDLGFSYSTFCEWANGRKYPRIDKIEMLANYFGIEKSDLIEEHYANKKHEPIHFESVSGGYIISISDDLKSMQERWFNELGYIVLTDDELTQLINYARFLLSQRSDK